MIDAPISSTPLPPTDTLGYIRKYNVDGIDMFCASEQTFFVFTTDLERYVKECEACTTFKKGVK